jgi:signal transduction histidine kinase
MIKARLLRTSSFRLTLLYMLLFSASVLVLAAVVYVEVSVYAGDHQDDIIEDDLELIMEASGTTSATALLPIIARHIANPPAPRMRYLLQDAAGTVLAGNLPAMTAQEGYFWFTAPRLDKSKKPRPVRGFGQRLDDGGFVLVGQDRKAQESLEKLRELITRDLGYGFAATLLLALIGGVAMSAGLLRRVDTIGQSVREIMEGDLTRRLPLRGVNDEFDRLASGLNSMLERIEAQMESMRQVSTDIAHDLRTPLTRLRQRLERAAALDDPAPLRAALARSIDDVDAILATFTALLRIAQIEADQRKSRHTAVDYAELLHTLVEVYQPMMEARQQTLSVDIAAALTVLGDRDLLAQMLANLLENASRHAPDGASISVAAHTIGTAVETVIADNGPGIPVEEHAKVFRRLYRLERSRTSPGSGLGLALVAAIAHMHAARIALADNRPGLRVTVVLDAAPADS